MTSEPSSSYAPQAAVNAAEAQLQQELCAMFALDTQQHFQTYFEVVQQLNPESWTADIQNIYRAVHTVKGGAVTVEAEAILRAATVLEDLLSDLRYLDQAPSLDDGQLGRMLQEAGELLSSALEVKGMGEDAIAAVQPTVERIRTLHAQIKQRYIPDWNELTQVHQEFAEQGFDLVILDLEMAVNQLPAQAPIAESALQTVQQTLAQLTQIGGDLQLADDWTALIDRGYALAQHPDSSVWQHVWPLYFAALKDCAKHSGQYPLDQLADLTTLAENAPEVTPQPVLEAGLGLNSRTEGTLIKGALGETAFDDLGDMDLGEMDLDFPEDLGGELDLSDLDEPLFDGDSSALADDLNGSLDDDLFSTALDDDLGMGLADLEVDALEDEASAVHEQLSADFEEPAAASDKEEVQGLFPALPGNTDQGLFPVSIASTPAQPAAQPSVEVSADGKESEARQRLKIPVPLERLDQSAQQVVEALLTTRATLTLAQSLESQVSQLAALSQESSQYITRLRQLQDDYALLRSLSHEQDLANGTSVEQYRQGYTTINRLLENILRMSELSREIEGTSHQTVSGMGQLDRDILRLKDEIEVSRLVPFKNLSLRGGGGGGGAGHCSRSQQSL